MSQKQGNWVYLGDVDHIHVVPLFGPRHVCTYECWCHPLMDAEDSDVIVHNVAH